MKTFIPVPALIAVSLLAGAAHATDVTTVPRQHTVGFADLDLARPEGAAVLYARINAAAREVCAVPEASFLASVVPARECAEAAIARAVADVNAPALTTYFVAKSGRQPAASALTTLGAAQRGAGAGGAGN